MSPSIALIRVAPNTVLPIRIFINRKQLLQNNYKDIVFQAPLLSNNAIVCIKSPSTRIYLSNNDMQSLTKEIQAEILLIVFELTSPQLMDDVLKKIKTGQSIDWNEGVMSKIFPPGTEPLTNSHIQSITRISKFKYKLHFKQNWELNIFVDNIKVLARIRASLLFKDTMPILSPLELSSNGRVLLHEQIETPQSQSLEEDGDHNEISQDEDDQKPILKYKYAPVIKLRECINVHVLQRPQRHKKRQ